MYHQQGLTLAVRYFGGKSKLARALGVKRQDVDRWGNNQKFPYVFAVKIEKATAGSVSASLLCPELAAISQYYRSTPNARIRIPVKQIRTEYAHPKPLTGVDSLKKSIAEVGLKKPVLVTSDQILLCGYRRLHACLALEKRSIDVAVLETEDLLNHQPTLSMVLPQKLSDRTYAALSLEKQLLTPEHLQKNKKPPEIRSQFFANHLNLGRSLNDIETWLAPRLLLGGKSNYQKLKQIIKRACPEILTALNQKELSVHAAYQRIRQPLAAP